MFFFCCVITNSHIEFSNTLLNSLMLIGMPEHAYNLRLIGINNYLDTVYRLKESRDG